MRLKRLTLEQILTSRLFRIQPLLRMDRLSFHFQLTEYSDWELP